MDATFTVLGLIPARDPNIRAEISAFAIDYTFWLNIASGTLAIWLFRLAVVSSPAVAAHRSEHYAAKANASAGHGGHCRH